MSKDSQAQQGSPERDLMTRALHELQRAQQRVEELEAKRRPAISIVGAACRLPGGIDSPTALWRFLHEGRDGVSDIPADRWDVDRFHDPRPGLPGRITPRTGAFLEEVAGFDAAFFGISPAEAELMDPQQRLLLEACWHALEDAGQPLDGLSGSAVGTFVGISTTDYSYHLVQQVPPDQVSAHCGTGTNHAVAAGRIAYALNLTGPCLALDTACSSSLVALHLACESLRNRECDLALVAGVNVISSPLTPASFSHARMLSPDGRCKTFAAQADGYGRGEGVVALLLTRSDEADRRGLRSRAQVLGSFVNQDGRSAGLTVPRGAAQTEVIQRALQAAAVEPKDISYVEAHGTGTQLGDPIELQALADAFGKRPPDQPLWVGSIKTNLGHTEAVAGLLGVLKVALQLEHRELVPHLHFDEPNPHINWSDLSICVPTSRRPWDSSTQRLAGVSSFGFSGTNAHVVLGSASPSEPAPTTAETTSSGVALPLSAADPAALEQLAQRWLQRSQSPDANLHSLAATAQRRTRLVERAVVLADTLEQLRSGLSEVQTGQIVGHAADPALREQAQAFLTASEVPRTVSTGPLVRGPYYPFQHRRFWFGPQGLERPLQLLTEGLIAVREHTEQPKTAALQWALDGALPDETRQALGCSDVTLNPDSRSATARLWSWAPSKDPREGAAAVEEAIQSLLVSAARAADAVPAQRLYALLHDADETNSTSMCIAYAVRAALRALFAEQPSLQPRTVIASPQANPTLCARALLDAGPEAEWHVTATGRRKVRFHKRIPTGEPSQFRSDRSYLVTGGSGALGQAVTAWLLEHGAGKVLVASRNAKDPSQSPASSIEFLSLDVGDREQVRAVVQEHADGALPLDGIFHFAGIVDDALVTDLDPTRISEQLRAKLGALHLHDASMDLDLGHFVCASSAVTWLGNAGQSAYAAANGLLDGLCAHRRTLGLPALAIAFGPWAHGGMAAAPLVQRRLANRGIRPLQPATALNALGVAMSYDDSALAVVDVAWPKVTALPAVARATRLQGLLPPTATPQTSPQATRAALVALPTEQRTALIQRRVVEALAEVLGQRVEGVEEDLPPAAQGLDSLLAVDLRYRLATDLGIDLPVTTILTAEHAPGLAASCQSLLADAAQHPASSVDPDHAIVENLTDEQVRAMLRERSPGDGAAR